MKKATRLRKKMKAYWAKMTKEERSKEARRRLSMRKKVGTYSYKFTTPNAGATQYFQYPSGEVAFGTTGADVEKAIESGTYSYRVAGGEYDKERRYRHLILDTLTGITYEQRP